MLLSTSGELDYINVVSCEIKGHSQILAVGITSISS